MADSLIDLVDGMRAKVLGLKDTLATAGDDQPARDRAATDLDALATQLAKIGGAAKPEFDLQRLVANLRAMAGWLRHPTPESTANIEAFVAELRSAVDLSEAKEAALRDAAETAEIKATVKGSLDAIFSKPVPKPY